MLEVLKAQLIIFLLFIADGLMSISHEESFECGVPRKDVGLIVGGEKILKGDFPWYLKVL